MLISVDCLFVLTPAHGDKADTRPDLRGVALHIAQKVGATSTSRPYRSVRNVGFWQVFVGTNLDTLLPKAAAKELIHVRGIEGASSESDIGSIFENLLSFVWFERSVVLGHVC